MFNKLSISKRFFKIGALAVLLMLLGSTEAVSMKTKLKKGLHMNEKTLA